MRLSHIETLLAALDEGSFTRAAERLHLTQPSVSHAIARLEDDLGTRLLERDRTGLRLTPSGVRLLPHLRAVQHATQTLLHEARTPPATLQGKVRIGTLPSTSIHVLPRALHALHERHPHIEVLPFEGLPNDIHRWLEDQTLHLGFLESPAPPGYQFQPVLTDEYRLITHPAHPLAQQDTVGLADIAAHPFILSKFGCEPVLRAAFTQARQTLDVKAEVSDLTTLYALVQQGVGVSLVPELLLTGEHPGIAHRRVTPRIERQIGLAHPGNAPLNAPARALWDEISALYRPGE